MGTIRIPVDGPVFSVARNGVQVLAAGVGSVAGLGGVTVTPGAVVLDMVGAQALTVDVAWD